MNLMIFKKINTYIKNNDGLAFIEGALILPMLLTLLFGLYDIGQAIIINQKVTSAAHMAADLVTRKLTVNNSDMLDAYGAARLVIDPYDRAPLGMDIVGIQFDDDDDPEEKWRYTNNMTQTPSLPSSADGLGVSGEGVVAVSVVYPYTPYFSGGVVGSFEMQEISYLRGRKNSYVRWVEE
jgi:Flp pilus assembly protein TadG